MAFAESGFAQFVASPSGRVVRVLAGLALMYLGVSVGGSRGLVLVLVGVIPVLAGVLDLCFISRLLGGPLRGAEIRGLRNGT
jgi:hypothetical protein